MSTFRPAALAVVVVTLLACAPAAHAMPTDAAPPVAQMSGIPSEITTTVTPGSKSTITSPTIPPAMTTVAVDVTPQGNSGLAAFDRLTTVLASASSLKKRVLSCIYIYKAYEDLQDKLDDKYEFRDPEPRVVGFLFLSMCMDIALRLSRPAGAGAQATSAKATCKLLSRQVAATFTKTGSKYRGAVGGKLKPVPKKSALRVSCAKKGAGYSMRLRPRAKGKSLRSIVGSNLSIGLVSPADAAAALKVKVGFRP